MKEITDKKKIEAWKKASGIQQYFDTPDLQFRACCYSRGELLSAPMNPLDQIVFLVQGSIQIYGIREEGSVIRVDLVSQPTVLGDLEYCTGGETILYAEAVTEVICLTLPLGKYRKQLDQDVAFLHMMLQSVADKMVHATSRNTQAAGVEERLLLYLRDECPDGRLSGVGTATMRLHCSRRQLQRVLKKLCEEGRIVRIGKGSYCLAENWNRPPYTG